MRTALEHRCTTKGCQELGGCYFLKNRDGTNYYVFVCFNDHREVKPGINCCPFCGKPRSKHRLDPEMAKELGEAQHAEV